MLAQSSLVEQTQYSHTAWTLREGLLAGAPRTVTQTADGYLWIGTEGGPMRFDGVRLEILPETARLPTTSVTRLLGGRDGSLWIGTRRGLARYRNGALTLYPELADQYVTALLEDREGTIWAGTSAGLTGAGHLCAIAARVDCDGDDGALGRFVLSLHQDPAGRLWVGAATGLWQWPGTGPRVAVGDVGGEIHTIRDGENGELLLAVSRGVQRLTGERVIAHAITGAIAPLKPTSLLRDRRGRLWIGTQDQGLIHVRDGVTHHVRRANGLSGDFVAEIFEDREGNVWAVTLGGFDRFTELAVTTVSATQGLSIDNVTSVVGDQAGGVWFGTTSGLYRLSRHGRVMPGAPPEAFAEGVGSLFRDAATRLWVSSPRGLAHLEAGRVTDVPELSRGYIHAITADRANDVWVSDQDRGLMQFRQARLVAQLPWTRFAGRIARSLAADPRGGLWLGFFDGGVSYLRDGRERERFTPGNGLGTGVVSHLFGDRDGALWAATEGGLTRIHHGRAATLTTRNGLPCNVVHWAIEDRRRALWLHTGCGLLHIARADIAAWIGDANRTVQVASYDHSDGVPSFSYTGSYGPKVAATDDGRLWFATNGGLAVVDPEHIPTNRVPPPVYIERVATDRQTFAGSTPVLLPVRVRDIRIDYTAPSLSAPDKVVFRYLLEGRDTQWVDAGNRRQAFYSDLPPGRYRFRVTAANNNGVWNERGTAIEFVVAPAFYQRASFRAAVGLLLVAAVWGVYRLRLKRVRAAMNAGFEARLSERTRIAQELHDTLLQGFVSASMQLHLAAEEARDHPIRPKLERIVRRVTDVIEEGRRAVDGLRAGLIADDLEAALTRDAEALRGDQRVEIKFVVEGQRQPLQPVIRDEVYRITREAMANAFRHAQATRVEVGLEYAADGFCVQVRDDGRGMDQELIAVGRSGHWGIRGMRERAESIGASLKLWSRPRGGTELELRVPAHVAFPRAIARRPGQRGRR